MSRGTEKALVLSFLIVAAFAFVLQAMLTVAMFQEVNELKASVTFLRRTDFTLRQAVYQNWHRGAPQPPR